MGSQWTSKYAILRDLSFAQGRKVPAAIVGSVGVGQKPPAIEIKEDTEEEFFQNCIGDGDGDACTKPDLSLIKQMINMVQESDPVDGNDGEDLEKVVEISKLNPLSNEFVPNVTGNVAKNKETTETISNEQSDNIDTETNVNHVNLKKEIKPTKKRRARNAAIMSLLEKEQSPLALTSLRNDSSLPNRDRVSEPIPEASSKTHSSEVKLLKPNDFIMETNITESVAKVNEWLQKPVEPQVDKTNEWLQKPVEPQVDKTNEWLQKPVEPQVEKTKSINVSPMNMFKKRAPAPLSLQNTCMFKRKSDSSSIKSSDSDTVPKPSDNVFVPSIHANEYYKKYVERRQVQEMAEEDIWKRAERLMKEIDAKRFHEKEKRIENSLGSNVELNVDLEDNLSNNGSRAALPINIPGE